MGEERDAPPSIDDRLRGSRAARQSLHNLVARMRQDRRLWQLERSRLLRRARLTPARRQRLRQRCQPGGGDDSTVC